MKGRNEDESLTIRYKMFFRTTSKAKSGSVMFINADTEDDYFLLRNDFDEMIENISSVYISNNYLGLFSWLIDRAFLIVPQSKGKRNKSFSQTETNKAILLNTLYHINKKNFLKCFSKNA